MNRANRFLFIFFCMLPALNLFAQDDPTISIRAIGGSNVGFHINSLNKYNEGISLEGWTRLRLRFDDPNATPVSTGWILSVKAESTKILSDNGIDELDLNTLEIRVIDVEVVSGVYNGGIPGTPFILDSNFVEILTDDQNSNVELIVTLSYDFGTEDYNKVMGNEPGYYFVDLNFKFESYL